MVRILKKRLLSESFKSRQQEIERCLTAFGVMEGNGRRAHRPGDTEGASTQIQKLRQALEHLGPVFSAFGLYMASRVDVLPGRDCRELAAIADWGEVTPIATVRELITQQIGRPHDEVFPVFEDVPCVSRMLYQSHRAWLNDGQAVTVTVIHPALQDSLPCDVELLPVLQPGFAGTVRGGAWLDEAIADFRRILQWQIDLLARVKAFETLTRDAQEFAMLKIPKVYKELCSARMITLARLSGMSLGEMLAACDWTGEETALERHRRTKTIREYIGLEPHTLARRLCMVWLRQALLGGQFPVEWHPDDLMVLPTKQIAFTGGVFASLPSEAKKNLWQYMIATSTEDPEKACAYLWREIVSEGRSSQESELRYRFREVVPFRDGGWSNHGVSSSLTAQLFVHWKLVSERGLRLQPHLLCFYRGLFQMLALVRRFAPESDALLEGLQDVRTIAMLAQFQGMTELQTMIENLDRYTAMLMGLPRQLDDVLTLATERRARLPLHGTPAAKPHGRHNASPTVIALLLALASVVLLSRHLMASALAGVWVERVSVMAFVVLGALLLRAASRA